jgi:protein KRI1
MPTRFKYTHVPAQSFALTPDEVLMATDAELNQYLSVKKYATYRKEGRWDHTRSERLKELKERLKTRGARWDGADLAEDEPRQSSKKRKGKKERMKAKDDPGVSESAPGPEAMAPPTEPAQTDAENALDGKPTERQEHTRRSGASSHKRKRQRVKGGHMGES